MSLPSRDRRGPSRRELIVGGALSSVALAGCGQFDATSWLTRERYDVDRRFEDSMSYLAPPVAPSLRYRDRWSMLVVSDLHCYDFIPDTMESVSRYLRDDPVDFVCNLGDLADRGYGTDYSVGAAALESLGLPTYWALGNHDVYHEGWTSFARTFGPSVYELYVGDSLLLFIDTAGATLGGFQRPWLEERLELATAEHIFVMTHYPLWPGSLADASMLGSQQEIYDQLDLLRRYDVAAHVSGHTHVWSRTQLASTELITVSSLREGAPDRSALRVDVGPDGVVFTRISFDPEGVPA